MNKWFKLALNSFIAIIIINFITGILFGGGFGFNLASLLVLSIKLLYTLVIVGLVVGITVTIKNLLLSKE